MQISIEKLKDSQLKSLYPNTTDLGFGKIFTDYMFTMYYRRGEGWVEPKISPYAPLQIDPAAVVLHYSQEIFEGLKAYHAADGRILLFRPEQNAKRMMVSAQRICMEPVPEEVFLEAITTLVNLEKRWIPRDCGTSLYIRPTLIGCGDALGIHPADEYLFFVILSPVGAYFKGGFRPLSLYVEDTYVRTVNGGVGAAKTGGNYAASLMASEKAKSKGFTQVLWLDAREQKYLEEVGAMNIFLVFDNKLVTPNLNGSILPGITRSSVITLAKSLGYEVEERPISITETLEGIASGHLTEIFGTGTAAVISPVGSLFYQGRNYQINNNQVGRITQALYQKLVDLQYGKIKDSNGWVRNIGKI